MKIFLRPQLNQLSWITTSTLQVGPNPTHYLNSVPAVFSLKLKNRESTLRKNKRYFVVSGFAVKRDKS
jgi:hypothetical protein